MLRNTIQTRLQSMFQKRPPGSGRGWRKRFLVLAGVTVAFFVIGHLAIRFIVWPQIEKSKPAIERLMSHHLGANVTVDEVQMSWTGMRPNFVITGLRINNSSTSSGTSLGTSSNNSTSPLLIQNISGQLSWYSLYHLAPYFHQITFDQVELYAQRDAKGVVSVAGMPIKNTGNDFSTETWLLTQNDIRINNAKIFWEDRKDRNLNTSFDIQNAYLTNGIRSHQGQLIAKTPWSPNPMKVKADFVHHLGGQAGNWRDWIGTFTWDLADVSLSQISQDISLPLYDLGGKIDSIGNLKLDGGKPDGGEMSLKVDRLRVQRAKDEDPIVFDRLETELIQDTNSGLNSITTKTLAWRNIDSASSAPLEKLGPITFRWRPRKDGGEIKEFGFSSSKIQVVDIALFARNLPLPKKIHEWIKRSEADGELQNVEINWSESKSTLSALPIPGNWFSANKLDFSVSAKLNNISFIGINKAMPSVSNLSGNVISNQKQGNLTLDASNLGLEINDFLSDPQIQLDRAKGDISWSKQKGGWQIDAKKMQLSNPDITTNFDLSYLLTGPQQTDQMTLDMSIVQAKMAKVHRYFPVGVNLETRQYLSKAFESGDIQNGSIRIKGDPDQIPFPPGSAGEIIVKLPFSNAIYNPTPLLPVKNGVWTALSSVNGIINIKQAVLNVDIDKANYKKVMLNNIHSQIPDLSAKRLALLINGQVNGDSSEILEYLIASPLGVQRPSLAKHFTLTGPVNIDLGLKIPLTNSDDINVDAKLTLAGNKAQWDDLPPLENLKGKIRITETNPEFENITANFLGGVLKVSSANLTAGNSSYSISGDINAAFIKKYASKNVTSQTSLALLNAMSGSAKYDGLINFNKLGSQTNLKFDLRNWASSAPVPAKKLAGASMLGELSLKTYPAGKLNPVRADWSGKLDDQYFIQGNLNANDEMRNVLGIGSSAPLPQQGLALHLTSNELNLDQWVEFLDVGRPTEKVIEIKKTDNHESEIQISAQVKKLTAFNREWTEVNINSQEKNKAWQVRLNSPEIVGQVQWHLSNIEQPSGLITGRLSRIKLPDQLITADLSPEDVAIQKLSAPKTPTSPNAIPSLDLVIDDLSWSKAHLGTVKIKSKTTDNLLKIESIQIDNPQGNSTIQGQWIARTLGSVDQSSITVDMNIKDAGQIIARWSSQNPVEGGAGKLKASLSWSGPIFSPDYDSLAGNANLNLNKGRLLEVNSAGAKLLDVLSLQSIFRFATFDLQGSLGNLTTKGTSFNTINSNFEITQGIAQTKQFNMILDQARVAMTGQINVPKQTQDLRVTIFPTIDATAGSLAAFAINPIVGLGALLGQYLISNQINRSLQTDYLVQGSWENPEVVPLDQKGQPLDAKTLETIRTKNLLKEQIKPSLPDSAPPASTPSPSLSL
jgi:uncharacterized protein (TIGR02099 family)